MIRFAHPFALALLALLPLAALMLFRRRARATPKMRFSSIKILGPLRRPLRARLRPAPKALALAAAALSILALARPQVPWSEQQTRIEGIDIVLVIDVSQSMSALDFRPNRLEKAKEVVKDFVRGRKNDQIGIVIFGKDTFSLAPLTHDYAALETFIDRIGFDLVNGELTAIGMGLANAVNKLKDSPAKSKVVILLTDGENNAGEIHPLTAAGIAKELKVRVYTIAVGSQGPVDVPITTSLGQTVTRRVISNIDTETLGQIAEMTGGKLFEATDERSLEQIYGQIDQMERTKIEANEVNFFDEMAHWLLIPAVLLLALGLLLEGTWLWSFP